MRPIKTRPPIPAAPTVGRFSANVFAGLAKSTKYVDPKLATNWAKIIGEESADLCRPGRLTGGRTGRTLEIFARNATAAAKIHFEAEAIRRKVNDFLGPDAVGRLTIIHKEEPNRSTPAEDTATPLGSALSRFRASVSAKADKG